MLCYLTVCRAVLCFTVLCCARYCFAEFYSQKVSFIQVFSQQENRVDDFEHLYSKVDRTAILRAAQAEDRERLTPPYLDNNTSYDDRLRYRGSGTFGGSHTPPPIPVRTIHEEDDDDEEQGPGEEDPRYATIRSTMSNNHDEGYSTVEETQQRGNKVRKLN